MSSLAATQADGYYIPPSYIESGAYKKKSLNQHAGSKGHNQFLQRNVCRFELPFDGFCTKCDAIVGKGTRFNAHKAHVDDYFTTKIYEFTTRCRACGNCEFKIRTNPKGRTFDYVSGIRKKVEEFDSAEAGTHGVIDTEIGNGILQYKNGRVLDDDGGEAVAASASSTTTTGLNLLEKHVTGHRRVQTEHEQMTSLLQLNSKTVGEDADANASVRAAFRKDRKAKKRRLGEATKLGLGRGIELKSGEAREDVDLAKRTMWHRDRSRGSAHRSERDKLRSVRAGSIFAPTKKKEKTKLRSKERGISGCRNHDSREKAAVKTRTVHEGKSQAVPKKKIILHQKSDCDSKTLTKVCTSAVSDEGAFAALSTFYGSDSE